MNAADHKALRDDEITRRTRDEFQKQRNAILAGDKRATTDACNSLADYFANSPDWPTLIRTALCGSADVTGKQFTDLLVKVMQDDAEVVAIRTVEGMEAAAKQDPENFAPRTHMQAVALDWLRAGA